jgi:hypothetical protein
MIKKSPTCISNFKIIFWGYPRQARTMCHQHSPAANHRRRDRPSPTRCCSNFEQLLSTTFCPSTTRPLSTSPLVARCCERVTTATVGCPVATCSGAMFVTPEVIDAVTSVCHCSIIYEKDVEFGDITTVDPSPYSLAEPLPSQRIDLCSLEHLQPAQRKQILELIDDFA